MLRILVACLAAVMTGASIEGQDILNYESAPFRYSESSPDNRIERLQAKLAAGELKLTFDPKESQPRLTS